MDRFLRGLITTLFLPLLIALSFGGVLTSTFDLRATALEREAKSQIESIPASGYRLIELQDAANLSGKAANAYLAQSESSILFADRLFELAWKTQDFSEREKAYCGGLQALRSALAQDPLNSTYMISWVRNRSWLRHFDCGQPFDEKQVNAVIAAAVKNDPTNMLAVFEASKVLVSLGKRARALQLLKIFLSYNIGITAEHQSYIARLIKESSDIDKLIPVRIPQALRWARIVQELREDEFSKFQDQFERLQIEALRELWREYEAGKYEQSLYYGWLKEGLLSASTPTVRRFIDERMVSVLSRMGRRKLASYHDYRSKLNDVQIIPSTIANDTRPQKGVFAVWGGSQLFSFDEFFRSVGFFLSSGQSVKLIELHSDGEIVSPESVKLFISQDNETWNEVQEDIEIDRLATAEGHVLAIRLKSNSPRYWKVHYASAVRRRQMRNTLSDFVKVYGASSREGA